jgi:hypothetical protein
MADAPIITEFALNATLMPQTGPPLTGQWGRGQAIFDTTGEMYICIQGSVGGGLAQPALWKHLSGGGSGSGNYAVEDLTCQIDGNTSTFTSAVRTLGTISVFRNGQELGKPGTLAGGAHVEELSTTSFRIDTIPKVGEELHIRYFTP